MASSCETKTHSSVCCALVHSSRNMVETCSILTTTRNAVNSAFHERMPVILTPDTYDLWLDPGFTDVIATSELFKPYERGSYVLSGEHEDQPYGER